MKETLTAFPLVLEKTVEGALWYCAGNHELLSCFSVLFFKIFCFTSLMMFATPIIVIIFIQLSPIIVIIFIQLF